MVQRIPLGGKRTAGRVALIDDEDAELVNRYRWRLGGHDRYAVTWAGPRSSRHSLYMHVLIMGRTGVDHINCDTLDNRRANLRFATRSQNHANRLPYRDRTSQYKGVFWHTRDKRWQAGIGIAPRRYRYLGHFTDEIEAAKAYDAAARELFGEYARPNFEE